MLAREATSLAPILAVDLLAACREPLRPVAEVVRGKEFLNRKVSIDALARRGGIRVIRSLVHVPRFYEVPKVVCIFASIERDCALFPWRR